MTISIIVAVAANGVIGNEGGLPWHLPADLRRFKRLTMGHHLILGRRTWQAIGRPLPGRTMVVISRQLEAAPEGVLIAGSLDRALQLAAGDDEVFVGGGAEIYRLALPRADRLHLTRVHADFEGDTHFPEVDLDVWRLVASEQHGRDDKNPYPYSFLLYER